MSEEENVKVAVRVRPFNKRERKRKAKLIVKMSGNTTYLQDPSAPNEQPKVCIQWCPLISVTLVCKLRSPD